MFRTSLINRHELLRAVVDLAASRSSAIATLGIALAACASPQQAAVPGVAPAPALPPAMMAVAPSQAPAPTTPNGFMPAPATALPVGGAAAPVMPMPGVPAAPGAPTHMPGGEHRMNDGLDHCRFGDAPDPRDAMLTGEPERFMTSGGQTDLLMPQEIRQWMTERGMQRSHDDWHLIRQVDAKCFQSNATPESCRFAKELADRGLKRFPIQECSRLPPGDKSIGDGKMFMWEHRHMLDNMNAAFPQHKQMFTGFEKVPRTQNDPNNPMPWRNLRWTPDQLAALDILENIEDNADMFRDEEYLAWFIQCRVLWTPNNPNGPTDDSKSGFHLAMHAQWAVFGSPSSVGDQLVSIENFTFWKLHGWVDNIWHRWRATQGLTNDDPEYKQGVFDMCKEMHELTILRDGQSASVAAPETPPPTLAPETGFFAEKVRPFLNERCSSCHGGESPVLGMRLGGMTGASSDIIAKLVNADSSNKQYKLVVPGNPDQSWLYLKASGDAMKVMCTSCVKDIMPPAGEMLNSEQLGLLRQWITDGARSD